VFVNVTQSGFPSKVGSVRILGLNDGLKVIKVMHHEFCAFFLGARNTHVHAFMKMLLGVQLLNPNHAAEVVLVQVTSDTS